MTVFPYDQFAKDYLKELLSPLGEVETSRNIAGEVREIDVWFAPRAEVVDATELLPPTPETLWLRILGKGRVQEQAIDQLAELPENDPLRIVVLELLSNLKAILEVNQNLAPDEENLIMRLSPLYEQRLAEATQRGIDQGQRIFVENLLRAKFGELDEELTAIIEPLLALPPADSTALLLQLSNLSRAELLARFN
ncbi:hypothetical protein ACE1CI_31785 [Aerosakkonemataceae cyanobacterium BLCC-F50]|uniref:Flagellar assembly protein H n=1 Tax=Floridaenema flaviceps BLCC-F50 TaxID=3153642 RepID=A0ABV4Y0K2_9CYAN